MHWRRKWQPTPVFLPGESQGWQSLVGCRLWGCTELDTTERLHFHFSLYSFLGLNNTPLSEKAMAPHSSTLAWKIPWTEEPGRLQSMGSLSQTQLSNFTFTFHFHALEKEMATHSSILAGRVHWTEEPDWLWSMGSQKSWTQFSN